MERENGKVQETGRGLFIDHCGIEIIQEEDRCYARVEIGPSHLNPYGIVHGGLMYTMADTATGYTARMLTESPVTLDSDFHLMRNVSSGVLTARTEILKAGKHVIFLKAQVFADDELLLAEGTFTYYSR